MLVEVLVGKLSRLKPFLVCHVHVRGGFQVLSHVGAVVRQWPPCVKAASFSCDCTLASISRVWEAAKLSLGGWEEWADSSPIGPCSRRNGFQQMRASNSVHREGMNVEGGERCDGLAVALQEGLLLKRMVR